MAPLRAKSKSSRQFKLWHEQPSSLLQPNICGIALHPFLSLTRGIFCDALGGGSATLAAIVGPRALFESGKEGEIWVDQPNLVSALVVVMVMDVGLEASTLTAVWHLLAWLVVEGVLEGDGL